MKEQIIKEFVSEVVREHDWTMPPYNKEDYDNYGEYECDCLDIGHDYELDIAELAIERMIKAGKITQDQVEELGDEISDVVWETIVFAVLRNMDKEV